MTDSPQRRFSFISLFPELVEHYFRFGVLARAQNAGVVEISNIHLRKFAIDRHGTVDGRPYGGGEGMVLRADVLANALSSIADFEGTSLVLPSPRGRPWTSKVAEEFALSGKNLVFICPRFSGVDQRFIDRYHVQEFSLGDFVVSGGELPAILFADSIARFIPGVLGDQSSADQDSFGAGLNGLLEYPLYTRPDEIWGAQVPEALRSGDHRAISEWRKGQSELITADRRPDLLRVDGIDVKHQRKS